MQKHLFNESNDDENIDKSNDDGKDDPFHNALKSKKIQSHNSFEDIQENKIIILNNNEIDIISDNDNESKNDLGNSSYIQLNLGDTIHLNDLVDINNEMLDKISETNRIDGAPTNYSDFKHDIEKESQNLPLNHDYDFRDYNINDEFLSQNGNLNDSSLFQDSIFNILQNDNNKNKIIENEPSPLLDQYSKNCDNFLEIFGNNSFKEENNKKHRENTFVNTEAKECFNGNFNNKSNQQKEKIINGCSKSEKKIENNSNEVYKKEIFEEKNNHNSIEHKDKKEQKIPQISKNNFSQTNFPTPKEIVNFPTPNPSKKSPFSQPTENAISNVNLINMNFSGFSREDNNINNQLEQNISPNKLICKKRKREKDNKRKNEAKNNLNDLEKTNIYSFNKKRTTVMREINKNKNENKQLKKLHDPSRGVIREFRRYLKSRYNKENNDILSKVLGITNYKNDKLEKLFSDDDAFHLYEEFLQIGRAHV